MDAAGGNQRFTRGVAMKECAAGFPPVKGNAGAADGLGGAGIDQHGVHMGIVEDGLGLRRCLRTEVHHAQDAQFAAQ